MVEEIRHDQMTVQERQPSIGTGRREELIGKREEVDQFQRAELSRLLESQRANPWRYEEQAERISEQNGTELIAIAVVEGKAPLTPIGEHALAIKSPAGKLHDPVVEREGETVGPGNALHTDATGTTGIARYWDAVLNRA